MLHVLFLSLLCLQPGQAPRPPQAPAPPQAPPQADEGLRDPWARPLPGEPAERLDAATGKLWRFDAARGLWRHRPPAAYAPPAVYAPPPAFFHGGPGLPMGGGRQGGPAFCPPGGT